MREAKGPARAWHIYFSTAHPQAFSLCALFYQDVFVKYVTRLATV